jgi:aminoglycoside N3'-acetyltransferase
MTQVRGIFLNENNEWDIEIQNGICVTEDKHQSFAKHNLLCFGRADKNIIGSQIKRNGYYGVSLSGIEMYSQTWLYYLEASLTSPTINQIISEFESSCQRDKRAGLIESDIKITDYKRLDKNKVQLTLKVGDNLQTVLLI